MEYEKIVKKGINFVFKNKIIQVKKNITSNFTLCSISDDSSLIDIIEEKNFFTLIKSVINGDIESYVRASAIRALSALFKINKIRFSVNLLNFSSEIIVLIQKETEGIVRQEGVLLLKQIYSYFNEGYACMIIFKKTYLLLCNF